MVKDIICVLDEDYDSQLMLVYEISTISIHTLSISIPTADVSNIHWIFSVLVII